MKRSGINKGVYLQQTHNNDRFTYKLIELKGNKLKLRGIYLNHKISLRHQ